MNRGEGARWAQARSVLRSGRRSGRFLVGRYRRVLLALAIGVAVVTTAERAAPTSSVQVMVTTRNVTAGERLADATKVVAAPDHAITRQALPPGELGNSRAAHAISAGELVAATDVSELRIPAGKLAMPIRVPADVRAWLQAGDQILLYPARIHSYEIDPYQQASDPVLPLGGGEVEGSGTVPIGPVRVLRTEPEASPASNGGSDTTSVLVLIHRDQAPRLAEASASGSLLPALMP